MVEVVNSRYVAGFSSSSGVGPSASCTASHARHDVVEALLVVGQGQQVEVLSVQRGPGEVIGDPDRLRAEGERAQPRQVRAVEGIGRSDRHRGPVQGDRMLAADSLQQGQPRAAARVEEALRDDLDPGHGQGPFED